MFVLHFIIDVWLMVKETSLSSNTRLLGKTVMVRGWHWPVFISFHFMFLSVLLLLPQAVVHLGRLIWGPVISSWSALARVQCLLLSISLATWLRCQHMPWWLVQRSAARWSAFSRSSRSVTFSFSFFGSLNHKTPTIKLNCIHWIILISFVFFRPSLAPVAATPHSNCSSRRKERTSSSRTTQCASRRFQLELPMTSFWVQNTCRPWNHSESAVEAPQVCATVGYIKSDRITIQHIHFWNFTVLGKTHCTSQITHCIPNWYLVFIFSSQQIWRNLVLSIPASKKANVHGWCAASSSPPWFEHLTHTFHTQLDNCLVSSPTAPVLDIKNPTKKLISLPQGLSIHFSVTNLVLL